ncbi:MAG: ATP-binding protein [Pyrinomonadaceae bacterium]
MNLNYEKILSTVSAEDFIGREREMEAIRQHSAGENPSRALVLLSAPALGVSEVLRQTYDRMFSAQDEIIPFCFSLRKSDKTAKQAALRFLQSFLQQAVAFRRKDSKILDFGGDVLELSQLAVPSDGYWIDRLIETFQSESRLNDERSFVRNCLSAPLRAAANYALSFVIIDDLHEAEYLSGEVDFVEEIKEIFGRSEIPFVLAGRRRFVLSAAQSGNVRLDDAEILQIEPLSFAEAGFLAENLAGRFEVKINEQTRDLIATQFGGSPAFIKFIFEAASDKNQDLDSFQRVEQIYADELFGGRIGKFYDKIFSEITPKIESQKNLIGLLYDALTIETEKTHVEAWQLRAGLLEQDFYRAIRLLNAHEIIRLSSNLVEVMSENEILTDYITSRFRLETIAENRALVVGETLSEFLKRAPRTMAKFYRRSSAIGVRELLSVFNCQETPVALLDYAKFRERYKGLETGEISRNLAVEAEKIALPQIVYTAHTVAFYPAINQFTEKERSAVALGFEQSKYTDEDEIVWIAAEIDSKLEATKELAEFWCDRLEMVALMCNFLKYKLWLIAPEGFSPEAAEVLQSRNAFGSSRRQIDLLVNYLDARDVLSEKSTTDEYEMVVPMGEDTEMIAAHAIEEIARRHHFAPKAINQIKTALVEACINAAEHSSSPDRKIYQKISVEDDKITLTISNRGLRLADKNAQEITPDEGRRGWGLKLMKTLMDEVKLEQVDDGTRISMTKYLKK